MLLNVYLKKKVKQTVNQYKRKRGSITILDYNGKTKSLNNECVRSYINNLCFIVMLQNIR